MVFMFANWYIEPKEAQKLVKKKRIPYDGKGRYNGLERSGVELFLLLLTIICG